MRLNTLRILFAAMLALVAQDVRAGEFNVGGVGALKCWVAIEGYGKPDFLDRAENVMAVTWVHGFISALNIAAQSETKTFVDIGSMTPQGQAQALGERCSANPDEPFLQPRSICARDWRASRCSAALASRAGRHPQCRSQINAALTGRSDASGNASVESSSISPAWPRRARLAAIATPNARRITAQPTETTVISKNDGELGGQHDGKPFGPIGQKITFSWRAVARDSPSPVDNGDNYAGQISRRAGARSGAPADAIRIKAEPPRHSRWRIEEVADRAPL